MTAEFNGAVRPTPTAVNISVGSAGDSAAFGTDYTPVAGFVLTIPAGDGRTEREAGRRPGRRPSPWRPTTTRSRRVRKEITVHGTASGLSVEDATLTLNDDDTASTSVSLSLDPGSVSEDAGSVSLKVTATLDQQASPEPTAVTLTVGRTGDAAESGTDYTSIADYVRVVLTIPGGQTTGTATFTLTPVDDELAEGPETITVHGTASGLSVDDATLTLNDDDTASTSVSLSVRSGLGVRGRRFRLLGGNGNLGPAGRHGADRGERHRGARRRHRRFRDGLHARRRLRRHDPGGTDDRDGELHSAADG